MAVDWPPFRGARGRIGVPPMMRAIVTAAAFYVVIVAGIVALVSAATAVFG